ncbi:MAG: GNAT family N-acetyltransferase [Candidatus Bipolaricaulota bacterium]|nr:GNAT family N-acetyltransferase [Candidatus Bipolaricaulota bacterium]
MIHIRKAQREDAERVLAISAQIWDGNDYVPSTLADWLTNPAGELLVAEVDGTVVSFAYRTWLLPRHAWLQGIRTDPAYRGKGVGRTLSRALIDRSCQDGATRISLSTYFDNTPSIRIIESLGFERVASFVYLERTEKAPPLPATANPGIAEPTPEEVVQFVSVSPYLATAHGWYPFEWLFLPFAARPQAFLEKTPYRIGTRSNGGWRSLLCASPGREDGDAAFLSFLDGDPGDFAALLVQASRDLAATTWESMIPRCGEDVALALACLRRLGFTPWQDGREDVLCYDLIVSRLKGRSAA